MAQTVRMISIIPKASSETGRPTHTPNCSPAFQILLQCRLSSPAILLRGISAALQLVF
jgi:hypothetical protein